MKALLSTILLLGAISFGAVAQSESYCPKEGVVTKCRKALVPYKYTNMVVNRIVYKRANHVKEVTIPLYYDARYRLVFNTELLPKDIIIQIWDRPIGDKKRTMLQEYNSSEKQFNFEPTVEKGMYEIYINFLIPAYIADDGSSFIKGCVIVMTGYEDDVSREISEGTGGN